MLTICGSATIKNTTRKYLLSEPLFLRLLLLTLHSFLVEPLPADEHLQGCKNKVYTEPCFAFFSCSSVGLFSFIFWGF